MLRKARDRAVSALIENMYLKVSLAFVGALLVFAGFQGYSIAFISSGILAAVGILTEVSLMYVISIGIENTRQEIGEQRREIDRMLRDVREISREIEQAKGEVSDVRREVGDAKTAISESQRKTVEASNKAENAKREIKGIKRAFDRANRRF